jgi:asparagine synthase (glutamine-hydrolysing)
LSGIVGIFHRDGAPIDAEILRAMTLSLRQSAHGPQVIWTSTQVGLGHALLNIAGSNSVPEGQIAHLGGLSIAADVRLDAVIELREGLRKAGRLLDPAARDATLILHAYETWGPGCVDHLRGDFAFGIWNAKANQMFCARDHFGVKPFYYATLGDLFLFSNTLNCLRRHPAVSKKLNEAAIGDFLLFGLNYNPETTTFRDIQRLPPAYALTVTRETLHSRCYWAPPTDGRIRYRRDEDYVERFNELLKTCITERLPADRIGILLSGGLDSGCMATTAMDVSSRHGGRPEICSFTVGYDSLLPDEEGAYARKTAEYLTIPNQYLALDHVQLFENWDEVTRRFPEPLDNPLASGLFGMFDRMARDCAAAFCGEGPDNLMYFQMWPYIQDLRRSRQWARLVAETAAFAWIRPLPWRGAARRLRSLFGKVDSDSRFPQWLAPEFARRAGLLERWKAHSTLAVPSAHHAVKPKAHASMLLPQWTHMFEFQDPGVTHCPLEFRYPFLDLRLVDYLLAIPPFPWSYKKKLLRAATKGKLPEVIRLRPKAPLSRNPVAGKLRAARLPELTKGIFQGQICEFVAPAVLYHLCDSIEPQGLRPYSLGFWLRSIE